MKKVIGFMRFLGVISVFFAFGHGSLLYASGGSSTWLSIFTENQKYHYVIASIIIILGLIVLGGYVQVNKKRIIKGSDASISLFNILEMIAELVLNMIESVMPGQGRKYFPLIATIFVYILVSNLTAFIPGFLSPSTSISNNMAMGIISFLFYNYCGFKAHGFGYLKHFTGPVLLLAPFMFVLELISHALRPISLSLRLFGNLNGDHIVLGIFSDLIPFGVPIVFLALGLLVAIIQTYIFSILSVVYISTATSLDH